MNFKKKDTIFIKKKSFNMYNIQKKHVFTRILYFKKTEKTCIYTYFVFCIYGLFMYLHVFCKSKNM